MNFLLSLLILSLPLGAVFRVNIAQNIYVYPTDIFVGLIFIYTVYNLVLKKTKLVGELKWLGIFLSVGFISLILNTGELTLMQFVTSLSYALRFAAYVFLIFAFQFVSSNFYKRIPILLTISGILFIIFGFIQYIYYNNLKNLYYLGWDDHLYRLFSTFLDPNFAGSFLVLVFLFLIGMGFLQFKKKKKWHCVFFLICSSFCLVSIYLTYSRSAIIMLIVSMSFFFVLHKLYRQAIISAVIVLSLFFVFANSQIEGMNPFRIVSSEARIKTATESIEIISQNPILGVGFNSYRYAQVKYGYRTPLGIANSNADSGTDNSFLFIIATTGVVGLFVYLKFWQAVAIDLFKIVGSANFVKRSYTIITISSVTGLFVNSLFINSLFYVFIMTWIFILVGMSLNNPFKSKKDLG